MTKKLMAFRADNTTFVWNKNKANAVQKKTTAPPNSKVVTLKGKKWHADL